MRIVVYGQERRVGVWQDEFVVDVNRACAAMLSRHGRRDSPERACADAPPDLAAFIEAGPVALRSAREAVEYSFAEPDPSYVIPEAQARFRAPWPGRRIACAGGNYSDHLLGMQRRRPGNEHATVESVRTRAREEGQWGFWKVPVEVVGPDEHVPYPRHSRYLDYEGELAIVLAYRAKEIPAHDAAKHVWGMTLLNDWSKRDDPSPAPSGISYNQRKNFDGSTSMGPCIVVGDVDPPNVDVQTAVNGEVRQRFNTREMVFSFGEMLAFLSRDFTFVPGDVVSGGTAGGTAADQTVVGPDGSRPRDLFLKVGDVVEVSSPTIGVLRNSIVETEGQHPGATASERKLGGTRK